jgi:hypothetical protein
MSTIWQVQQPLFCADAEFGGEYENYCARTRRLVPWFY